MLLAVVFHTVAVGEHAVAAEDIQGLQEALLHLQIKMKNDQFQKSV